VGPVSITRIAQDDWLGQFSYSADGGSIPTIGEIEEVGISNSGYLCGLEDSVCRELNSTH